MDQASHEYSIIITTAVELEEKPKAETLNHRLRFPKTIIVVNADSSLHTTLAAGIRDHLLSSGGSECRIVSLTEASKTADLPQCFCFFLLETDQQLLADLDTSTFAMLQRIITKTLGILWVTDGGGVAQEKPQKHLVDGISRVARTEFNQLIFVTLALENLTPENDDPIRKITKVFEEILAQPEDDFESEYQEQDEIGRALESNSLNQEIHVKNSSHQHQTAEF